MSFRNILLIDDDHDDQEIFLSALAATDAHVNCAVADNGRKALEQLTTGELRPELIFVDMNMPIMNGKEFLQEIKSQAALKDIPVIIFSTSANPKTIREAMETGAYDFITKPNHFHELKNILAGIFGNGANDATSA